MPFPAGAPVELREVRHFHLFCGLGAGARGFNRGTARVGNMQAVFRCLGGIDVSPAAIRDFGKLAGVPGTVLDLFDADQYAAFHGAPHLRAGAQQRPRMFKQQPDTSARTSSSSAHPAKAFRGCSPKD